jgi:hypothetical protein
MRRISAIIGFALVAAFAGTAFAASPDTAFLLRHGAIIDSVRGAAYVAKPNGTIDAVDLASGRTLWTSADAAIPLGADQEFLVAQVEGKPLPTERFQLVIVDAAGGRKLSEATITLPAGARALIVDEKGKSFRATAEREGALFLVSWVYQHNLLRPVAPKPGESPFRFFAGSARINPQTGRVVAADGGLVDGLPGRWQRYGTPPAPPWLAGNVSARTEGGRGGPLTLKRSEVASGRPLPDQALSKEAITSIPSANQRHLLVSERVGDGGPDDPEYRWAIFAMDTAEKATELRNDVSAASFFVFSDSVIFESMPHGYRRGDVPVEEPLEIHAVRLTTGVAKWEIELRDLSYRRPRPPAR